MIRTTNPSLNVKFSDFIPSISLLLPVLAIYSLKFLFIFIGFIFLTVPGVYLAVTLQMAIPLYIEFHRDEMTIIDSLVISLSLVRKKFWAMLLFLLLSILIGFGGVLAFGIGLFVSLPIAALSVCYAISDIFGLRDTHLYAVGAAVVGNDFSVD